MDLNYPNADRIDSTCDKTLPREDLPSSVSPRCNEEAVTWVVKPDGTRLYICEDHALELLRFPEDDEDRLRDMDYNDLRSLAAERGINLENPDREELISRMAQRKDPEDLPENPRAKECPTCRKLTLESEFDLIDGRCVGCSGDRKEVGPPEWAVETG